MARRLNGRSRVALGEEKPYFEYLPDILTNYGRAIESGRRHTLHSLPRIITLFCDFGMERYEQMSSPRQVTTKERNAATQVCGV